jgi:hypothetical protein
VCIKGKIESTKKGHPPTLEEIDMLLQSDDSKDSNNLSPTLYVYIGQQVMITANIATSLGAANGAQGTVCGIKFATGDTRPIQSGTWQHFHRGDCV